MPGRQLRRGRRARQSCGPADHLDRRHGRYQPHRRSRWPRCRRDRSDPRAHHGRGTLDRRRGRRPGLPHPLLGQRRGDRLGRAGHQRLRRHGVIGGSADQAESAHPAARTPPTSPAPPSTDAPFHPARDPLRPTGNTPRPAGAPFNMPGHGHGRGPRRDSPAVCPPSARTGCGSPAPPDPDTTPTGVTTTGAAAVHGHGAGSRPAWGV